VAIFGGPPPPPDASGWALGIVKAGSEAAAQEIMNDDPFVRDGVVEAELFPFNIIAMEPNNL